MPELTIETYIQFAKGRSAIASVNGDATTPTISVDGKLYLKSPHLANLVDSQVPLGDLGSIGYVHAKSLETDATCRLGSNGSSYPIEVGPGESALMRWNGAAIHALAVLSPTHSATATVVTVPTTFSTTGTALTVPTGISATADASTDVVSATGSGFSNGNKVAFTALTGGAGLTINTVYYVVSASGDTFKVSATLGGSAIDITTDITSGTVGIVSLGVMTNVSTPFVLNDKVAFTSLTGGSGLSTGTIYYVVGVSGSIFKLSATLGGSEIDFTTDITECLIGIAGKGVITATGSSFLTDDIVRFTSLTGGSGLTNATDYYVVNANGTSFGLSATLGGSVIEFSTAITAATIARSTCSIEFTIIEK